MTHLARITKTKPTQIVHDVFVQKSEMISIRNLLVFFNKTLDCELLSMDDLKTGAVYCQVMHRLFPKSILIEKVKFYTHSKVDFKLNFRLLLNCFEKLKVTRYLPVEELILGHSHYDLCNWMYKFFQTNDNGREYDAKKVRKNSSIGLSRGPKFVGMTSHANAMQKCQSMIFNYIKDPNKYERRSCLGSISYDRINFTKTLPDKQIIKQKSKPPPKKSAIFLEFHPESKYVPLPSESEDELNLGGQQSFRQNKLLDKLSSDEKVLTRAFFTIEMSNNPRSLKNGRDSTGFKSLKALSNKCNQYIIDLQTKVLIINDLKCKIRSLATTIKELTEKFKNMEQVLIKYGDNPTCAVQKIKNILFLDPQMAAVPLRRPHRRRDFKESYHSEEKAFTIEFSNNPKSLKNGRDPTNFRSLSNKCDHYISDHQTKVLIINDLKCKIRRLDTKIRELTEKWNNMEHVFIKYSNNPTCAVKNMKNILFIDPQVAAVPPRRPHEKGETNHDAASHFKVQLIKEGSFIKHQTMPNDKVYCHLMPSRHSKETKTCIEFVSKKSVDSFNDDPSRNHMNRSSNDPTILNCHSKRYTKHALDSLVEDEQHNTRSRSPVGMHCCHIRDWTDIPAGHQDRRCSEERDSCNKKIVNIKSPTRIPKMVKSHGCNIDIE
ncbi:uncharacterized protein LOC128253305 [Drosophila gunungcola]|uniref:Calponin-homology (CH) domain-containing protein n=1 Tax=Drosophila gunungcola TaxID=103775 RepID=A0A9Q0BMM8_9MUSC|nr:uncharacterized protein LOC128253305 [Drosophila gunungcola]KAI8038087.1 hypothetical protein M5D96_009128 [Drosophila gunungcola]